MQLTFEGILVSFLAIAFSCYGSWLVYQSRKRFTPGLVRKLATVLMYSFLNLVVYSFWILLLSVGAVEVESVLVRQLPTLTLLFLFVMVAVRTEQLAREYGFAGG